MGKWEGRGRRTEVRGQRTEVRSRKNLLKSNSPSAKKEINPEDLKYPVKRKIFQ